ncbi:hypothetical protein NCCP691_09610 [Noviherbaspirillum aridicola]|uniref:DUF721 domain-containing protein n=1 Tax=Noviherbaspirillum aridicola TaxID=2849687 RepID=A0ABQ4Q1R3_9BURK|nr:hypothetical protein NCCP691_09610 [Noviherbaspirillum aridicola]
MRGNDKMAALLPTVARLAALQQDCASVLPALFDACSVLSFESGQLVLAAPNAAFAAKLKQQLPKLQEALLKGGWQVSAIRIKVQVRKIAEKTRPQKQLVLPSAAKSALASLKESLEETPQNQELKAALEAMLKRHVSGYR